MKSLAQQFADLTDAHKQALSDLAAAKTAAEQDASKIAALSAEIDALKKSGDELAAKVQALTDDSAKLSADLAAVQAEADRAKKLLALTEIPSIAGTEPDKGAGAAPSVPNVLEQYAAITDPAAKHKFFREHETELMREIARK